MNKDGVSLFNPSALRNLPFIRRSTVKRQQFRVTLNPQTIKWLKDNVYVGSGSGYGSVVIELSLRLLLSLLTADPTAMVVMCEDLKQALSEEGLKKFTDNTWILTASLAEENSTELMSEDQRSERIGKILEQARKRR